ncbi:hypothetical protein AB0P02_01095 [Streptomyces griseoluteus]|uniref:hypothetical protein n=1 Tax=Streptomyces griseoluteus TaxID=29306 RepID=UPI00343817D8
MSRPQSSDARAVLRAAEQAVAQLRRIADHLTNSIGPDDAQRAQEREYAADIVRALDAKRRQQAEHGQAVPDASPLAACRRMKTLTCPESYNGPCGDRLCARFESDDPAPWADTPAAPAADEDAERTARRASTRNLLARLERSLYGPIAHEVALLRQHVEAEIREANTAREVARGNLRHVQVLIPELEQAQAAIARVRGLLPTDPGDDYLAAGISPITVRAALDDRTVTPVNPVTTGDAQPAPESKEQ